MRAIGLAIGRIGALAGVLVAAAMAAPALAHEPYLFPATFSPGRAYVSFEAARTEGAFFVPDMAMRGAELFSIDPAGAKTKVEKTIEFKQRLMGEIDLPTPGTYRISTGDLAGRTQKVALVKGVWRPVRPAPQPTAQGAGATAPAAAPRAKPAVDHDDDDKEPKRAEPIEEADVPKKAKIVEIKSVQKSETYVTKGAPNDAALKPSGQGVELVPLTHPNEIFLDQGFSFQFTLDGKPLPGVTYVVARALGAYGGEAEEVEGVTDAQGKGAAKPSAAGLYILKARYGARDLTGKIQPPAQSYLYTLSFEATE